MKVPDNDSLDEMRRRIQESLIQAKREQLRDEFEMQFDHIDGRLLPEAQNEWLNYILNFERQSGNEQKRVESFFRLQPSPYFGWDVVQTSLLEDLLAVLS